VCVSTVWDILLYFLKQKICYRLTDCCIVTDKDSSVQADVLSKTQTVTQFIIHLLFTSVIQGEL